MHFLGLSAKINYLSVRALIRDQGLCVYSKTGRNFGREETIHRWVPPAKLLGKLSRRALDKTVGF